MAVSSTSWKKGFCPNPGGRIGGLTDIRDKCLTRIPEYLDILDSIIKDEGQDVTVRIAAINMILDRGLGKPSASAHIEDAGRGGDISRMSTPQLQLLREEKAVEFAQSFLELQHLQEEKVVVENRIEENNEAKEDEKSE